MAHLGLVSIFGAASILFGMFALSLGSWGGYSELGNALGKNQPIFLIGQGLEKGGIKGDCQPCPSSSALHPPAALD